MNMTIFIIIAIAFLIIGFLIGNVFPVLSGFLTAENEEEESKDEEPGHVIEEHDSGRPEHDLPVEVEVEESEAESEPELTPQLTSQPQQEPDSVSQDELPEPAPTALAMDADKASEQIQIPEEVAPEQPGEEKAVPEKTPRQRPTFGLVDVMHIWRDDKTKELVVELEDRVVRPSRKISNEDHGELAKLLIDLNDWVGLEAQMEAMQRYQAERKKNLAPGSIRDYSKGKASAGDEDVKAIKPKVGLMEMFVRAIQTDVNTPLPEGLVSIVEQINFVLQEKLEDTPFAQRGIELQEVPGEGMLFVVGLEKYTEIGEIPDQEIQEIIRGAVAEWEQRASQEE